MRPRARCKSCGQIIRAGLARLYVVHSSDSWLGWEYRDPERDMEPDEMHKENDLTEAEARSFLRFFRDEMGFAKTTVHRAYRWHQNSTSFRRVRLK